MNNPENKANESVQAEVKEIDLDAVEQVLGGASLTLARPQITRLEAIDLGAFKNRLRRDQLAILSSDVDWH